MRCKRFQAVIVVVGLFISSCDPFAPEVRQIAHGYRLKRDRKTQLIAFVGPQDRGGMIIDEVGWKEPFIVWRSSGSTYWWLVDTARAQRISISDSDLKAAEKYRGIVSISAEVAWKQLDARKRIW